MSVFPFLGDDGVKVTPYAETAPLTKPAVRALTPHRLGEAFEKLRDAGDAFLAKTGKRKRVFMANLGEIAEHNRRSQWMWNFLAAGGIEGLTSDGYKDAAEAAEAFKASGAEDRLHLLVGRGLRARSGSDGESPEAGRRHARPARRPPGRS